MLQVVEAAAAAAEDFGSWATTAMAVRSFTIYASRSKMAVHQWLQKIYILIWKLIMLGFFLQDVDIGWVFKKSIYLLLVHSEDLLHLNI